MPKLLHGRSKEILAEVFHARPGEVEEMIKRRLEEGRWPATFCVGEWLVEREYGG